MSVAVIIPEGLEQRAGASDHDREAWLAERMTGVTATEVRDLYLKGATFKRELIEKKLGTRVDDFNGNAYTEWGKEREPIIAAAVLERYAIAPESRVFHAADNPRFLASPDGLGVDFDEQLRGAEIKTAGKNVAVGSEAFAEKGYMLQMQWCMRVTGARRWLYAWEYRLPGESTQFVPGQLSFEWVEYDQKIAAELERVALDFLADLDAARAAMEAGEGPVVDEELDTLAFNYLRFLGEEKKATVAKNGAFDALKVALQPHETFSQEGVMARITWTRGGTTSAPGMVTERLIDEDAAKAANPKVFETLEKAELSAERASARLVKAQQAMEKVLAEFTTTSEVSGTVTKTVRENLTVTEIKTKGMSK